MEVGDGLQRLDDDALCSILCRVSGPPPAKAATLLRVSAVSRRLRTLADCAAKHIIAEHLGKAHAELAALSAAYAARLDEQPAEVRQLLPTALDFDLDGPVASSATTLTALACELPKLPLQWTALRSAQRITHTHTHAHTCRRGRLRPARTPSSSLARVRPTARRAGV